MRWHASNHQGPIISKRSSQSQAGRSGRLGQKSGRLRHDSKQRPRFGHQLRLSVNDELTGAVAQAQTEYPEQARPISKTQLSSNFLRAEPAFQQCYTVTHPLLGQPLARGTSERAPKSPLKRARR
jgi:hypothetical protein